MLHILDLISGQSCNWKRQYLDLGHPCLNFWWFGYLESIFIISRKTFVLGISQHKSRHPYDILSYFWTTIGIPWISFLVSPDSFLASLGSSRLWKIMPTFGPGGMTTPSSFLHHSHSTVKYLSLRHWQTPQTRLAPQGQPKCHHHWFT